MTDKVHDTTGMMDIAYEVVSEVFGFAGLRGVQEPVSALCHQAKTRQSSLQTCTRAAE